MENETQTLDVKSDEELSIGISLPPVPTPKGVHHLPTKSKKQIVACPRVSDLYGKFFTHGGTYWPLANSYGPNFPSDVYLEYTVYWEAIFTQIINGPTSTTLTIPVKFGLDPEGIAILLGELNVSMDDLSDKMSNILGSSVSIQNYEIVDETYSLVVKENEKDVFILWQLIQEFKFVDSEKKPVNWGGWIQAPFGNLQAYFPNPTDRNKSKILHPQITKVPSGLN